MDRLGNQMYEEDIVAVRKRVSRLTKPLHDLASRSLQPALGPGDTPGTLTFHGNTITALNTRELKDVLKGGTSGRDGSWAGEHD